MLVKLAAISRKILAKLDAPVIAAIAEDKKIFDAIKERAHKAIEHARTFKVAKQEKAARALDALIPTEAGYKARKTKLINDLYRARHEYEKRMNKVQDIAHSHSKVKKYEVPARQRRERIKLRYDKHAEHIKNKNVKTGILASSVLGGSAVTTAAGAYLLNKKKPIEKGALVGAVPGTLAGTGAGSAVYMYKKHKNDR
jgi:hypothetical protein